MKKHFTLLELLIVIAIIAILFSMLFPSFRKARQNAILASCGSSLKQLHTAHILYAADHKNNPCPTYTSSTSFNLNDGFGRTSDKGGNGHKNIKQRPLNFYLVNDLKEDSKLAMVDCPVDETFKKTNQRGTSYITNIGWTSGVFGTGSTGHSPNAVTRLTKVRQPNKMYLVAELATYYVYRWNGSGAEGHVSQTNESYFNLAKVDGSVVFKQKFTGSTEVDNVTAADEFHVANINPVTETVAP